MTGVLQGSHACQWPIWFLDAQVVKCALSHAGGSCGGFSEEMAEHKAWLCSDSSFNEMVINSCYGVGPRAIPTWVAALLLTSCVT